MFFLIFKFFWGFGFGIRLREYDEKKCSNFWLKLIVYSWYAAYDSVCDISIWVHLILPCIDAKFMEIFLIRDNFFFVFLQHLLITIYGYDLHEQ